MNRKTIILGISAFLLGSSVHAQPRLNFQRVINNWPTIELYFNPSCDGEPLYHHYKTKFSLHENGTEIPDFELWCPDRFVHCAGSFSFVFGLGENTDSLTLHWMKYSGQVIIDEYDGVNDETAIVGFHNTVFTVREMTVDKSELSNSLQSLQTDKGRRLWDGVYAGLDEVINSGVNPCRAVLVFALGNDSGSTRTKTEVIALANRYRIRVFCFGYGNVSEEEDLQNVALFTGGRYINQPTVSSLIMVYQMISTMYNKNDPCIITYSARCMDGTQRLVELQLRNECGGSDSGVKTYKAPRDTSTFLPLQFDLQNVVTKGDTIVDVALEYISEIATEIPPGEFDLLVDTTYVRFKGVIIHPTDLFDGVPVTTSRIEGGYRFRFHQPVKLRGPGRMLSLRFHTSTIEGNDTVGIELQMKSWTFDVMPARCVRPMARYGEILIAPANPSFSCKFQRPADLTWDSNLSDYTPQPVMIRWTIYNKGGAPARDVRFILSYNKNSLQLITPKQDQQTYADIQPGDSVTVSWDLRALRRIVGDSIVVCVRATFSNHTDISCCVKFYVPAAPPILSCALTAPDIQYDKINQRYVPMPFDLTVVGTNEGGSKTDTVFAQIVLPPGLLSLDGQDGGRTIKKLLPSILSPGGSGETWWSLAHPKTKVEKQYRIEVLLYSRNTDTTRCDVLMKIPSTDVTNGVGSDFYPSSVKLFQNYPNPFNPSTVIEFELPAPTQARLTVFDMLGREVRELVNERRDAGLHRVPFSAAGLPGGVYLYRLETSGKVLMKQMAVVK